MMQQLRHGFWAGGRAAWWRGLSVAIASAKIRLDEAGDEDERAAAQAEVDTLNSQLEDATQTGHRWLF